MHYCCVPFCESKKTKFDGISFHRFPSDERLRAKWLETITHYSKAVGCSLNPQSHYKVCSKHFLPDCFSSSTRTKSLLPSAIPSVFESKEEDKSTQESSLNNCSNKESEPVKEVYLPSDKNESSLSSSNIMKQQATTKMSNSSPSVGNISASKSETQTEVNFVTTDLNSVAVSSTDQNNSWKSPSTINLKQNDITDLCFKGENLQQLSTNALPPYIPGSPPASVKKDLRSYEVNCCTDCGDTFAILSSLSFHLERRSVLIKLPCETCKSICIFYNRCTLLSHIRSHADKGEVSDIGKATVNPLPRVFMDGIQTEFVNTLDDELNSIDDTDITPPTELLEFSLKEVDDTECNSEEKEDNENESDIHVIKVKCLDCNEEFDSIKDRKEHLTNGDKIPVLISQCNKCGMVCPSKCSLKAHQRIHLQISPYVCPECGDSPDPHWANFQHHVNFKCFHNARSIGYKCPVCKRVSPSNDSLLKHMELHTEKYAKCDSCPRAYMSTAAFEAHSNVYHNGKIVKYNMIYKCSLCDIVFLSSDQMLSHRSTHLKEQICEYVFNCMQCGKTLENKEELLEHIKTTHPKVYKHIMQKEPTINKPTVSTQNTYRGMVECILCNCKFHSHQGYSVHIAKGHINVNQPCIYCFMIMPTRKEMIKHGKKHLQKGNVVCLLCNNKKCSDEKNLDSHLLKHIERLKFCTFCPICDQMMLGTTEALKHLREEHFIDTKHEPKISQDTLNLEYISCHFCRMSFVNENELQQHLGKEHNIEFQQTTNSLPTNATDEQPLKKQRIEGNVCAKCEYHSTNRTDFKAHILSHKTIKSTFQCQECGLCFVVEPSLIKHLRVVHKISDTKKYIEEEGTNFLPDFEHPTEISTRSALECTVCYTSFPNETSLKTHMRSHGMAFIQAKKSGPV